MFYRKPEIQIRVFRPCQYSNMKYSPIPRQYYDQDNQTHYTDAWLSSPGLSSLLRCQVPQCSLDEEVVVGAKLALWPPHPW